MRVLVTGNGGIGQGAIARALMEHGHALQGAGTAGYDAVVQMDGDPRYTLDQATHTGVRRFIYVSALGAQDGETERHHHLRHAENLVREWAGSWTICRIAPLYGPGDRTIAMLMKAIGRMPVIPVVDDHFIQPLWIADFGEAIARVVERDDLGHRTLDLAGPEPVSLADAVRDMAEITGARPKLVPMPSWLTDAGLKALETLGLQSLLDHAALSALLDRAAIPRGRSNAVTGELGVRAMSLGDGMRRLVGDVPEAGPGEGTGPLWRGRYWADIAGCDCAPDDLFNTVRDEFASLMPPRVWSGFQPGRIGLEDGDVISVPLPLRGDVQLKAEEIRPLRITFVTLEDQPFAGALRLLVEQRGDLVRFEVQTYERAANTTELLALAAGGAAFKLKAWQDLVERVLLRAGGTAQGGVQVEQEALPDEQAALVEAWVSELIARRHATPTTPRSRTRSPTPKRDYGARKRTT